MEWVFDSVALIFIRSQHSTLVTATSTLLDPEACLINTWPQLVLCLLALCLIRYAPLRDYAYLRYDYSQNQFGAILLSTRRFGITGPCGDQSHELIWFDFWD